MTKLVALSALLFTACTVGDGQSATGDDGTGGGGDDGTGGGSGSGSGDGTGISGQIASDQMWSGTVNITGAVTINAGVTVTAVAGTKVEIAPTASISIKGTLDLQGATGNIVTLEPAGGADHFAGVTNGGTYKMSWASQLGGGLTTGDGSTTTVVDSILARTSGDYIVMNGGALDMTYSQLGLATGDTTHCNMHLNKATSIKFEHNINENSPFGLMFYAGTGDFKHNNWISATPNVDIEANNTGTNVDVTEGYFSRGTPPSGTTGFDYTGMVNVAWTDVGPGATR